jgi:hypothetical protein
LTSIHFIEKIFDLWKRESYNRGVEIIFYFIYMNSSKSQDLSKPGSPYYQKLAQSWALETIEDAQNRADGILTDSPAERAKNWHTNNLNLTQATPIQHYYDVKLPLHDEIMNRETRIMRVYTVDNIVIAFSFGGPDGMAMSVDVSIADTIKNTLLHYGYDRMDWGKPESQEDAMKMNYGDLCTMIHKHGKMENGTQEYLSID